MKRKVNLVQTLSSILAAWIIFLMSAMAMLILLAILTDKWGISTPGPARLLVIVAIVAIALAMAVSTAYRTKQLLKTKSTRYNYIFLLIAILMSILAIPQPFTYVIQ